LQNTVNLGRAIRREQRVKKPMTDNISTDQQDADFKQQLVAVIPYMRAFARLLTANVVEADDLAQESLARAWQARASYTMGTNLKAWAYTIVRNQFYSDKRRSWRVSQLDPEMAERTLVSSENPSAAHELNEVRMAMASLPNDQREALVLIGAGGLSYEEAAEICGCAVGTVKSRVSRARDALSRMIETGEFRRDAELPSNSMGFILSELSRLTGDGLAA
jgi:RNA polymerase sigma-70 factor (ECF subfamily)